jgi:hypothetical protein
MGEIGSLAMLAILGATFELLRHQAVPIPTPAGETAVAADPARALERAA